MNSLLSNTCQEHMGKRLVAAEDEETRRHVAEQQRQHLFLLYHASICSEECALTCHCSNVKKLWKHIASGCRDDDCDIQHCMSSKRVLLHYSQCEKEVCEICRSLRQTMVGNQSKESQDAVFQVVAESVRAANTRSTSSVVTIAKRQRRAKVSRQEERKKEEEQEQQNFVLPLLYHVSQCTQRCVDVQHQHCWSLKRLWNHITNCKENHTCKVKKCVTTRNILSYFDDIDSVDHADVSEPVNDSRKI